MEKLLRKLLGSKSKTPPADTVESIQNTLAELNAKRAECRAVIQNAVARRSSLLLEVDSDTEIAGLDAATTLASADDRED